MWSPPGCERTVRYHEDGHTKTSNMHPHFLALGTRSSRLKPSKFTCKCDTINVQLRRVCPQLESATVLNHSSKSLNLAQTLQMQFT
jgi:hypothetical protein